MSSQEEPEDQPPADDASIDDEQPAGDEQPEGREPETPEDGDDSGDEDEDEDKPPTEDERLEQVTERIEKARAQAEEAGVLDDKEEEGYVESGATEEEDDQTITPPG